ncbi:S1 RNA-binding domain-containing protein [Aneurinibacillus danicus]|jgi:predicted RNA-binding protein with RPS1 domain|uniref:S1 motif domain-containing protein n=1 Tax=Aneurinibacillus danicus TaxID=267746 RepID=A0A511VCG1_9BACL|nr:S1 RNA-binding domain-containing protein [Aneurinibacillus danicus]GEN36580.1 hypothetical protein ADA01nite_40400 [Aneurinibacillus danicus]
MARDAVEWRSKLIEAVLDMMNNNDGERGEIKKVLEDIAETYGKTFNTVKTVFYKEIRPYILERDGEFIYENLDEKSEALLKSKDIEEKANKQGEKPITYVESPKELKVGDLVQVTATDITHYGVFAQLGRVKCLLHISNVSTDYIEKEDLPRLFKLGDIFEAYIYKIEDNSVSITTKGIDLKSKKAKINEQPLGKSVENNELHTTTNIINNKIHEIESKYIEDIIEYLNKYLGPVSPIAREKINNLYLKYGPVKLMMLMSDLKDFKVDPVLIFLNQIEKKASDEL